MDSLLEGIDQVFQLYYPAPPKLWHPIATMLSAPWLCLLLASLTSLHPALSQAQDIVFSFALGSEVVEIPEEQIIGTTILDLDIVYSDGSPFEKFEDAGYYSLSGKNASMFSVESDTGIVSNAQVLDFESQEGALELDIIISFTLSSNGFTESMDVRIVVADINDNSPTFTQSQYEVTIPESTPPGQVFFKVTATDADQVVKVQSIDEEAEDFAGIVYENSNGQVIYSLTEGNELNHFSIHLDTGQIALMPGKSLDVDTVDFYNLTVLAQDGGDLTGMAIVLITVLDSNDNAPEIVYPLSVVRTLPEDIAPGFVLVEWMNATDADTGLNAQIDFLIISGDVTNSFTINSTSGHIDLTSSLDREAGNPIVLLVAARDNGIPSLQDIITATVTLVDVNDNAPGFTEEVYQFSIGESASIGSVVNSVEAIDPDEGPNGTVTYAIINSTLDGSFSINTATGMIKSSILLDRETVPFYTLYIEAVDNPLNASFQLTSTAVVNISVADSNDHSPVFESTAYMSGVLANESVGYVVTQLHASDEDIGSNGEITYAFIDPESTDFIINPSTGVVTISAILNFALKSSYSYNVRALDNGLPQRGAVATLMIQVHTPNIKAPKFMIKHYEETVYEDIPVGTNVLNVTAKDNDPGLIGEVHYRIAPEWEFDAAGSFDVDPDTGAVSVNSTLDYDYRSVLATSVVSNTQITCIWIALFDYWL